MKWAAEGQQARRIEWTVSEKKRDPLHVTAPSKRGPGPTSLSGGLLERWRHRHKASPETSSRSGNRSPQAVPVVCTRIPSVIASTGGNAHNDNRWPVPADSR